MAKLTKEEWQVARERWENSDISHEALALEIGVSQAATSKYIKRHGWSRGVKNTKIKENSSDNKNIKQASSFVYLITAKELEGGFKIGITNDLKKRISGIQTGIPI